MTTTTRPIRISPDSSYVDLPEHERNTPDGECLHCGLTPADEAYPSYEAYLAGYDASYEGGYPYAPEDREVFEYLRDSCLGVVTEILNTCHVTRPGTLGYQRCQLEANHAPRHRSQDGQRWATGLDEDRLLDAGAYGGMLDWTAAQPWLRRDDPRAYPGDGDLIALAPQTEGLLWIA